MIKTFLLGTTALLFVSCSSGKVPYAWKGQTKSYLAKYQEMMLKGDGFQAKYYFNDAVKEAKNDASLKTLAVVYLSKCAMQIAMSQKTACQEYQQIKSLLSDSVYENYAKLLLQDESVAINELHKYRSLYEAIGNKEVELSDIVSLDTVYAQALGSMLVFNHGLMNEEIVYYMIDKASSENMRGLMLVWLDIAQSMVTGEKLLRVKNQIKILSD